MARYITKQAEIEAVQWNGENIEEIDYFAGSNIVYISIPKGLLKVRAAEGIITAVTGGIILLKIRRANFIHVSRKHSKKNIF